MDYIANIFKYQIYICVGLGSNDAIDEDMRGLGKPNHH
jgi:hypothetical protein